MLGGISRKRERPEREDDDATVFGSIPSSRAGSLKRQRLTAASAHNDDGDGVASSKTAAQTPKTPRTVKAVASAISSALWYGGGGGRKRSANARGNAAAKVVPLQSASSHTDRRSKDELDKLYEMPDADDDQQQDVIMASFSNTEADSDANDELLAIPAASTSKTSATRRRLNDRKLAQDEDEDKDRGEDESSDDELGDLGQLQREESGEAVNEEGSNDQEETLVGSPTPDTPSKKPISGTRRKKRDPLGNLAIDGTDRLKSGLEMNLTRGDRVRGTPKKYLDKAPGQLRRSGGRGQEKTRATNDASTSASTRKAAYSSGMPGSGSISDTPTKKSSSRRSKNVSETSVNTPMTGQTGMKKRKAREATLLEPEPALQPAPLRGEEQQQLEVEQNEDEDYDDHEDDEVCLICGKPDSEPPNEIVFCDSCELAVHQRCYHVPVIPEGEWLCKTCIQQKQRDQKRPPKRGTSEDQVRDTGEVEEVGTAPGTLPIVCRNLAPDIANFEYHLNKMKQLLISRCTGRTRIRLQGQDEAYDKAYQLVKQTVVAGEGNSMLVIGARGTGKTTMVESILRDVATDYREAFHVVRLNGFIHTDDKLALREIWRQLGKEMAVEDDVVNKTNNYADTLASLLALLSHPSEISATAAATGSNAVTSTSVVFIIDEFDLFATHARQTLLYNLFDIAQARKAPIVVLGLTTKVDVVESLEKRVKSRFSHRYVYLSLPRSLPAYWDICRHGLLADDDGEEEKGAPETMVIERHDDRQLAGHDEFQQWWKHMIETVRDETAFTAQLEFHFYNSKSVPAFWNMCIMPLAAVSSAAPRLQLPAVGSTLGVGISLERQTGANSIAEGGATDQYEVLSLLAPDSKLHLLSALSELELSLLIAAGRLDIVLSTDTVNFAMAYDEYVSLMGKQRVQSSLASSGAVPQHVSSALAGNSSSVVVGGNARVWGRGVAARAWERLASLGLLIPAGLGSARGRGGLGTSGLEGRSMWRTEVALEEIPAAPGVKLGAVLARWCKEI